ncbi:MAG: 30S ribosomal protein S13 [Candidatus Poseidoniia archaeon]|nr:30S ribosomal protein S13 [Candidatus Poseidoniia archaeon]MDP6592298.1 30S ribosomal protein S13 [Candidatus Poseidoniia archaeon]MDP7444180.1 30S ribosomal protein S13 [Candidatus Poseidoniia archaeon]MDP7665141.1 30S ribosomal protein S13 [Candidatus Poseidoniia archaeon]HJN31645.1 30S ribosomal protein S13 [Candidatus Poseidoniia archaeon]
MSDDSDFKYIIRIANSDVSGEERLVNALTSIRGIGPRISNAIVQKLKLDPNKLAGKLDDKNVVDIENAIMNLNDYVPDWLLNRQKDYDTGEDIHPVSVELKMTHDEDLNRMKKVKSYKGIRHASGHKVRGQRTYSNGRKGLALGVSRKKGAQT